MNEINDQIKSEVSLSGNNNAWNNECISFVNTGRFKYPGSDVFTPPHEAFSGFQVTLSPLNIEWNKSLIRFGAKPD